jgi:CRP-like cAMP-binding protein
MPEPASETLARLLALRQFDTFADVDLGELTTIANSLQERTFEAGTVVASPGAELPGAYLVVKGRLDVSDRGWGPRSLVGGLETIARRVCTQRIVAPIPTRTLLLPGNTFSELLEDNYGVLSTIRRRIASEMLALDAGAFVPTVTPHVSAHALGLVDRIMLMRVYLPPPKGNIQANAVLANASEEVLFAPGTQIYTSGERATAPLAILEGKVRLVSSNGEKVVSAATIGGLECLAESSYVTTAVAATPVRALRFPASVLFDVMEDHTDFAIALLRRLAGSLLDLQAAQKEGN